MSELRELFEIWATRKHVSQATHALMKKIVKELEALVKAVEPDKDTCGECQSFHTKYPEFCIVLGVDARDPACERFVAWVKPEDTDATIHKLCDDVEQGVAPKFEDTTESWAIRYDEVVRILESDKVEIKGLRTELVKAQAEIVKARDFWAMYQQSDQTVGDMFSEVNADAEIGRLVQQLPWGAKLSVHGYDLTKPHYMAFRWNVKLDDYVLIKDCVDPAEALRSIQGSDNDPRV